MKANKFKHDRVRVDNVGKMNRLACDAVYLRHYSSWFDSYSLFYSLFWVYREKVS
jgi:hypothetical protein